MPDEQRGYIEVTGLDVLVNQVGYDCHDPKRAIVQSETTPANTTGTFALLDHESGREAYSGQLSCFGRVNEGTEDDWGFGYWSADFDDFDTPGTYRLRAHLACRAAESFPFRIDQDLLWRELSPLILGYYRNGRNTPDRFLQGAQDTGGTWNSNGILEDDGRYYDVNGGWFEFGNHGGTFMRDAAKIMWSLVLAGQREPDNASVRDELEWGGQWFRKLMIHYPDSGRIISGMGGWHGDNGEIAWYDYPYGHHQHFKLVVPLFYCHMHQLTGEADYLRRAELFWQHYHDWVETDRIFSVYHATGGKQESDGIIYNASWPEPGYNYTRVDDAAMLFADVALHQATGKGQYLAHAERMVGNILEQITCEDDYWRHWNNNYTHLHPTALAYFAEHYGDHGLTGEIIGHLNTLADLLIGESGVSPFGVVRKNFIYYLGWDPEGVAPDTTRQFFNHSEEGKGVNPEYGLEAWQALMIHQLTGHAGCRALARNHINWILGLNPRNLCMMRGTGTNVPPMSPGGDLDGCVCHGLIAHHQYDRPWLGRWSNRGLDWRTDEIAGYKIWSQCEAITRGTAGLAMALALL